MTHSSNAHQKPLIDIERLSAELEQFATDRDWHQFHSPKNLVMALTGEVGELTEIFQWMTEEESRSAIKDTKITQQIKDELADVMLYLVRLSSVMGVDMNEAVIDKLKRNAEKYPADKVHGSSKKYNAT